MPILKNAKHERFAREYVTDRNGTQAAIRAGYSKRSAAEQAYDLLRNPQIASRVDELSQRTLRQADITAERVMLELARLAFADERKLFDEKGVLKAPHTLDDDTAAAISSMEFAEPAKGKKQGAVRRVRLAGKEAALRMLAQRFKLIGSEADEALNNLAMSFAEKVAAARARRKDESK
jgi:phage terminase small subunit